MILKLTLGIAYLIGGTVIGFLGALTLAMLVSAFAALFHVFCYRWTWLQIIGYFLFGLIGLQLISWCLLALGTLGDNTHYKMQTMTLVGLIFPAITLFHMLPYAARLAISRARGGIIE